MKSKLLLLLLCTTTAIIAQPLKFKPEIVEFVSLMDITKHSQKIEDYEKLFRSNVFDEKCYIHAFRYEKYAYLLLKNGNRKKAKEYLLKFIKLGFLDEFEFRREFKKNGLDTNAHKDFFADVVKTIQNIEKSILVNLREQAISEELAEMLKKDQAIRKTDLTCESDNGNTSPLRKVDSTNIYRLIELIKENPDIDVLNVNIPNYGRDFGTMLLMMHGLIAWKETWTDFFEPYFRKEAESGKNFYNYCFYYDRYCVLSQQGDSYYGEFTKSDGFMRTEFATKDKNLDEINKHRATIGLLPLRKDDSPQPTMKITF